MLGGSAVSIIRSIPGRLSRAAPLARAAVSDEPPIDPAYLEWRDFYKKRAVTYPALAVKGHSDAYSQLYQAGGYGYDPRRERRWLIKETSLPEYRGTCLDIGSGDGFHTILLSEWYKTTGIEPSEGGVEVANAIKNKLGAPIANRIEFIVGDALKLDRTFDVVFARAPSFFNYHPNMTPVLAKGLPPGDHAYAGHFREYLAKMLAITNQMFLFIMWTRKPYGEYVGHTHCHDPAVIRDVFAEFGRSNVRMDSSGQYIVGEIYK